MTMKELVRRFFAGISFKASLLKDLLLGDKESMKYVLILALMLISSLVGYDYGKTREHNKFLNYQQAQKAAEIDRENRYQ